MPLHWKEFSAWITIDGKEAHEFGVETSEDEKTVTCWIASEIGKPFSVNWENASYYHATIGKIKMDGNECGATVIDDHTLPTTTEKKGVYDGSQSVKPFLFSSVELTDDDAFLGSSGSSHQELGVIELEIYPVIVLPGRHTEPVSRLLPQIKVHERAKKAVTQQITLAKAENLATPKTFGSTERSGPDLVKFYFKYRPLEILQANGIAPLPPRPEPVDPPRAATPDMDLADAEEAKILRARLSALEAKLAKKEKKPVVKRELEASAVIDLTQPRKRVKLKAERPFISGEVIDLT
ncbi:hypothetical protein FB451DRAFT_1398313 [Mycena latifolia]|nr:hypothetical protein FB451DRAFT_1398313 [Mycena latifolia]